MSFRSRRIRVGLAAVALCAIATGAVGATNDEVELIRVAGLGDLAAVSRLLVAGVDVNAMSYQGSTALQAAAAGDHLEVVRALLAAKARPDFTSSGGWTPLLHAAIAGRLEIVQALLDAGADPDASSSSYGQGRNPLMLALADGNARLVRMLLAASANVNARTSYGATPLWFAMWHDGPEQLALVQALIDAGADVDSGHVAPYRIPSRPSRRSAEGTVLGGAAASGKTDYVRVLLSAGASVDARQPGWRTPLMQASASGSVDTVRLLLEADADVNAIDSDGKTALMHAREAGHGKTVELLELAAARSNGR